jgi:hypothetical protein
MRLGFATIATTLVLALLLAPVAYGQCGLVTVEITNYTQRQTGNEVFSYAESEVVGQDAL